MFDPSLQRAGPASLAIDLSLLKVGGMNDDEAEETPASQEAPAAAVEGVDAPESVSPVPPPRPFFFPRAPSRILITASGPNDDR
ncbi:MAG TPA: hypothetical protein VHM91_09560, partial [Verrucomicrobiales bacterium]|nr:hypothetical protein [Verrucomicrobiales bacterium]